MPCFNNWKCLVRAQKYALLLVGFIVFQDVCFIPTESHPQNGLLFGFLQPPPIIGNIIKGAEQAVQNILPEPTTTITTTTTPTTTMPPITEKQGNPLDFFFNIFQPKTSPATTTTTTTTTTTAKPNLIEGLLNMVNPFNLFKPPTNKTETTQATTKAPNIIEGVFGGIGNILGWTPTTTTTTLYPPPRGGRGFSGMVYNILNIIGDLFDILDNALLINEDWVPGYMFKKLGDIFESVQAEFQILLQIDQPGGLGEIWKSFLEIWNDLNEIIKVATSGDVGKMIGLPFIGGKTLQDIGQFNSHFVLNFPTTTLGPDVRPRSSERVKLSKEEFQNVMNHTESLVKNLFRIQEIVQNEFPNSIILKVVGRFRESFVKALEDSKTTGKPIVLDTIQKVFPNDVLADYIAVFGQVLSQSFQFFPPVQMIGNILQQKLIVNIGLSIVQAFFNPLLENIEKFIEYAIENIMTRYLILDPGHFIVNLINTLNKRIESFGDYLENFQNLKGKVKLNFTEGDVFQQVLNITQDVLTSRELSEFIRGTIEQILKVIPLDFGETAITGITSVVTDIISGFIKILSRGIQYVYPQTRTQITENVNTATHRPDIH